MPGAPRELVLTDSDLPPMFRSADRSSLDGQTDTVRWSALQLAFLVAGAVLGGFDFETDDGLNLSALAAATSLAASLIPTLWLAIGNPQRTWYRGRAAAESLRTLAWKFAVRAEPFACTDAAASTRLVNDIEAIKHDMADVWPGGVVGPGEITAKMHRLRQEPLAVRRQTYVDGRLVAEGNWYSRKAEKFRRIANRWAVVTIVATVAGLVGGFLDGFGMIDYDGLGSASAVAAAGTAWMQLKQYRPLAAAYGLTARELEQVKAGFATLGEDEAEWARRCSEAEDAISREHTMWLARREAV
ncbi:DUF4231 domain-containing protein [Streptomyces sp. NBC_01304]|uniref:DUF4231 domain-containing protein n=1 Tax=Streptomyces sp. NBC_01304 TaxID=2903818 RepID=UPI002E0E7D5D|nr:DUF4231 domain-containing protein [Streptomyces sp. NBC_01304]